MFIALNMDLNNTITIILKQNKNKQDGKRTNEIEWPCSNNIQHASD